MVVIQRLDIDSWIINIYAGLAVVGRWPLFRGGRKHRFDCISKVNIVVCIVSTRIEVENKTNIRTILWSSKCFNIN